MSVLEFELISGAFLIRKTLLGRSLISRIHVLRVFCTKMICDFLNFKIKLLESMVTRMFAANLTQVCFAFRRLPNISIIKDLQA